MAKVLCVLRGYKRQTEANAICLFPIIEIWKEKGHQVDVLSLENEKEYSEDGLYIVSKEEKCKQKVLRQIRKFIYMPLDSPSVAKTISEAVDRMLIHTHYDVIISVVNPVEAADAIAVIKRNHPEIQTILYEIDPASNRYKYPSGIIERLWSFRSIRWEKRIYNIFDIVIHMQTHRKHFDTDIYKQYKNKTRYLDIPSFSVHILPKKASDERISFVYAGAFYPELRNPFRMFEVLREYSKIAPIKVHIYTGVSMRREVEAMISKDGETFFLHNYVSQEELFEVYSNADVLIDLGNKESDFLSSKILQYIGTGKPVIHFSQDKEDVANKYVSKYPKGINIDLSEKVAVIIPQMKLFMQSLEKLGDVEEAELEKSYIENTPGYSAEKIMEMF